MTDSGGTTSIRVKSPRMLADLISWTQTDFYPDPKLGAPPKRTAPTPLERPTAETMDTVNFQKIDDENDWSDI
jgi:hypothetical protein